MPVHLTASALSRSGKNDGGLTVTEEMLDILSQPGFISLGKRGQRLRTLYVNHSMSFDAMKLSYFGQCCFLGHLEPVQELVGSGTAPDLEGAETPYKFGYATLIVAGAQRVQANRPGNLKHVATMEYLISCGVPVDMPDTVGFTALGHALMSSFQPELARVLLTAGANNRYDEVPLIGAMQKNYVRGIDLLMEFGADPDVQEADGMSPGNAALKFGPQVSAAMQKWIRKRSGTEAPRVKKRCDGCGKMTVPLKNCAKCRVARYCSAGKAWTTHKTMCKPFSNLTTVTLKPHYEYDRTIMPMQALANEFFSNNATTPAAHHRSAHLPKNIEEESKNLVIKIQLPFNPVTNRGEPGRPLFIYTKKRDFVCSVHRKDCPKEYDRVAEAIVQKGPGGAKAYFAAELRSKDELVVKVADVLAEQPF
ncbi:hypothetical protein DXG03_002338 [Asterophora parasitica]|uniref:Ankyrin n=1 Tax=Asterophora parasitica TaxID=117018 RepID=A0A9P7G4I3_9AGAR|nr:hypothetical protein DXG03_002338 [Asterophora parasitica]